MRIGILTFHNAINYGAVIQCYALMKYLEKRGHDVEIINYRCQAIEEYRKSFSLRTLCNLKGFKNFFSYIINKLILRNRKEKVIKAFDVFVNTKLNLSNEYCFGQDISRQYDYIIVGSDQIWNINLTKGFDPVFWGQLKKGDMVLATYAASMGEVYFKSTGLWKTIADNLKNFDFISVRELALKEYLDNKLNISVDCCVDPTFLIDSKTLETLAVKPNEDNFVYLYNVTKDNDAIKFAIQVANLLECKVIMTEPKPRLKRRRNKDCYWAEAISPEEFLGYIKYSRLVIGNSFHLIALSIVFGKDFYSLNSYRPERIKNVLKNLGFLDRHMNSTERIEEILPVDYTHIEDKLESMRTSSLSYINKIGL